MLALGDLLKSPVARQLVDSGKVVRTLHVPGSNVENLEPLPKEVALELQTDFHVVEHERVWFASYPYEWPPEMLYAAGELTLELAQTMLDDSFGLKDATPYNVLFSGTKPVFVDVLSFEKRTPGDPRWLPYGQFVRMFLLPLLMSKEFGTSAAQIFLSHRDGLEPEEVYPHTAWLQRLRSPCLTTVSLPVWLGNRAKATDKQLYAPRLLPSPEKAAFILRSQLRRAQKLLRSTQPIEEKNSTWSDYTKTLSYTSDEIGLKTQLVRKWLSGSQPGSVLDVGCNTGHFSQIAAEAGARVVAIDLDPVVVGMTWRRAVANQLNILALVVNLAWPTPALGWRNREYPGFLERASGLFDTVMMLAVVHHLLVTERIPLSEIVDLCDRLTTGNLIIEYVSKDDEMFIRLTRGREALHADFTQESFEAAFSRKFAIVDKTPVKGNFRWLYLLQKITG